MEWSLFSQLESCRILKEVFSRETAFHESCKFHKGDVVLEPTGDRGETRVLVYIGVRSGRRFLGPPLKIEIKKNQ